MKQDFTLQSVNVNLELDDEGENIHGEVKLQVKFEKPSCIAFNEGDTLTLESSFQTVSIQYFERAENKRDTR